MIIFILLSGIFTPLESMPVWAQKIDLLNPVVYIMRINRMVMLKGSSFHDISQEFYALILSAIVFTFLAVYRYRKTA
jgi:ABC-2 type transport system permease protein